ncbi:hypothetical protein E0E52_04785 [Azotobacter chroococcum]|uniref:hypothetical protein n=1 Tax=Azotobacter chroococcum TaxID=353 RepID=UPI00103AAEF1|nr:hypothetical protein [Azotobacter chroococcum]TBW09967.1 hypothetical protein E0E52_04785 [Azotobacter chroococcum]
MNGRRLLLGGLLLGALLPGAQAQEWPGIRDGALYLRAPHGDSLQVDWQPAWQAEANAERLYLQAGDGRLLAHRDIAAEEVRGRQRWALRPEDGDQRLEIPGYSFRRYRVRHADDTAALFEPVKLHFCAELPAGTRLYFRVRGGERAVLAGKYHGGVEGLYAERLSDGHSLYLPLSRDLHYSRSDRIALPVSAEDRVWSLRLRGRGKAAFWLDGSANLFAQRPEHLFSPELAPGKVGLELHGEVLGPTPKLGVALPYTPPEAPELLARLAPRAANHYSFVDVMTRNPRHERRFRPLYLNEHGIRTDSSLLAQTGRRAVLADADTSRAGLAAWIEGIRELGGSGTHYIAFADEPNLNYPDYASFAAYFARMAPLVRAYPGAREAGVRIAMPSSSRLVNGPTTEDANAKRGLDWARRLLAEHGEWIDALSWHEWMVRDLRATGVYRDSVRQAAQLVGVDAHGRPRKALLLEQTNLSSGNNVSPYEQETGFAALWWASVAVNAAQDGLLEMLNWFLATDDEGHFKGMIGLAGDGRYMLKPVGKAMAFMQRHWQEQVLRLDNDAFEVDVLAMRSGARIVLFGVNKTPRHQEVRLHGEPLTCRDQEPPRLHLLSATAEPGEGRLDCTEQPWRFSLPGETLFVLEWEAP